MKTNSREASITHLKPKQGRNPSKAVQFLSAFMLGAYYHYLPLHFVRFPHQHIDFFKITVVFPIPDKRIRNQNLFYSTRGYCLFHFIHTVSRQPVFRNFYKQLLNLVCLPGIPLLLQHLFKLRPLNNFLNRILPNRAAGCLSNHAFYFFILYFPKKLLFPERRACNNYFLY